MGAYGYYLADKRCVPEQFADIVAKSEATAEAVEESLGEVE